MLTIIFVVAIVSFGIAYFKYGGFLNKQFDVGDTETPSHSLYDGIDFVPAKAPILFGHHFSSIAGAGPIVGPILAGLAFGWLPAILWIVIGSIFLGGVHDFSSIMASIRHKAKSIAEIANERIGKRAYHIFLVFIWLTLVYVLIVFLDLTASNFANNGSVASASILYILLAILFGLTIYRLKVKLLPASILFVLLIFGAIYLGNAMPLTWSGFLGLTSKQSFSVILIVYAFIASVVPVWILLQPRDYLSSFLLYASVLVGFIGIIFGGFKISYPAFVGFNSQIGYLFPFLFVTIACGAISGFHSLVASGTTSKQLDKEKDARLVGYGGMLMEGVVALIALAAIMIAAKGSSALKGGGIRIYANGIASFLGVIGVPLKYGATFGVLVLTTFLLTTLDTATRLARYILQELFGWNIKKTRFIATTITLLLPAIFSFITIKNAAGKIIPVWRAIWPVFGATNQLLAAVVLLVISVWLATQGKKFFYAFIPMLFMFAVTFSALIILMAKWKVNVISFIALALFVLAVYLFVVSINVIRKSRLSNGGIK